MATSNDSHQLSNLLITGGVLVLMIQNLLLFLFSITSLDEDEYILEHLTAVYNADFEWMIDILGFLLLSIAFYMKADAANEADGKTLKSISAGFGAWVLLRIIWQHILMPDFEGSILGGLTGSPEEVSLDGSVSVFLLSSIALLVTGIQLYRFDKSNLPFLIYAGVNMLSSFFVFLLFHSSTGDGSLSTDTSSFQEFISFQAKFIVIPLLAIPAFFKLGETELKETFNQDK